MCSTECRTGCLVLKNVFSESHGAQRAQFRSPRRAARPQTPQKRSLKKTAAVKTARTSDPRELKIGGGKLQGRPGTLKPTARPDILPWKTHHG